MGPFHCTKILVVASFGTGPSELIYHAYHTEAIPKSSGTDVIMFSIALNLFCELQSTGYTRSVTVYSSPLGGLLFCDIVRNVAEIYHKFGKYLSPLLDFRFIQPYC